MEGLKLTFDASELRLRGDAFVKQPHTDGGGNILCWNGEVCLRTPLGGINTESTLQVFEGLEVSQTALLQRQGKCSTTPRSDWSRRERWCQIVRLLDYCTRIARYRQNTWKHRGTVGGASQLNRSRLNLLSAMHFSFTM